MDDNAHVPEWRTPEEVAAELKFPLEARIPARTGDTDSGLDSSARASERRARRDPYLTRGQVGLLPLPIVAAHGR
jgi:hypothetical protein